MRVHAACACALQGGRACARACARACECVRVRASARVRACDRGARGSCFEQACVSRASTRGRAHAVGHAARRVFGACSARGRAGGQRRSRGAACRGRPPSHGPSRRRRPQT
eukprot:3024361-Prymnesium_polylepis.1